MKWYYSDAGQQAGPIEDADFQELVRRGVVRDETPVWREGMASWAPYATVKPAAPVAPRPTPPAPQPIPQPAPQPTPQPQPRPAPAPAAPAAPAQPMQYSPQAYMPPAASAAIAAAESGQSGAFFFYPVLKALRDGRFIRRVVIITLQIVAILAALGGIFLVVAALGLGGGGIGVGAVIGALFGLVGALCAAQVFWYRAGSIRDMEEGDFTVIPIVSLLFRMFGEVAVAVGIPNSIGIGLVGIIGGSSGAIGGLSPLGSLIPGIPTGGGIVGGLIGMVAGCVFAFFALVFFYFLAESTLVAVDIAQHVRTLVKQGEVKK